MAKDGGAGTLHTRKPLLCHSQSCVSGRSVRSSALARNVPPILPQRQAQCEKLSNGTTGRSLRTPVPEVPSVRNLGKEGPGYCRNWDAACLAPRQLSSGVEVGPLPPPPLALEVGRLGPTPPSPIPRDL